MEKINREIAEIKTQRYGKNFAMAIAIHIYKMCEADEAYRARVDLEEKSLKDCIQYIYTVIKNEAPKGADAAAATDEEVYQLVDTYYKSSKEELKIDHSIKADAQAPPEKKAAEETTYAKVDVPPKVEVKKVKSMLTKKSEVKHRDPAVDNQVSLFDLMG